MTAENSNSRADAQLCCHIADKENEHFKLRKIIPKVEECPLKSKKHTTTLCLLQKNGTHSPIHTW